LTCDRRIYVRNKTIILLFLWNYHIEVGRLKCRNR